MSATYDSDADQCLDCAETDRLFHHVAGQRDQARADLAAAQAREARVRALYGEHEARNARYKAIWDTPDWSCDCLACKMLRALDGADGGAG